MSLVPGRYGNQVHSKVSSEEDPRFRQVWVEPKIARDWKGVYAKIGIILGLV